MPPLDTGRDRDACVTEAFEFVPSESTQWGLLGKGNNDKLIPCVSPGLKRKAPVGAGACPLGRLEGQIWTFCAPNTLFVEEEVV